MRRGELGEGARRISSANRPRRETMEAPLPDQALMCYVQFLDAAGDRVRIGMAIAAEQHNVAQSLAPKSHIFDMVQDQIPAKSTRRTCDHALTPLLRAFLCRPMRTRKIRGIRRISQRGQLLRESCIDAGLGRRLRGRAKSVDIPAPVNIIGSDRHRARGQQRIEHCAKYCSRSAYGNTQNTRKSGGLSA